MWRGGGREKGGDVADSDENDGEEPQGGREGVAEHGVSRVAARRTTVLHIRVRTIARPPTATANGEESTPFAISASTNTRTMFVLANAKNNQYRRTFPVISNHLLPLAKSNRSGCAETRQSLDRGEVDEGGYAEDEGRGEDCRWERYGDISAVVVVLSRMRAIVAHLR